MLNSNVVSVILPRLRKVSGVWCSGPSLQDTMSWRAEPANTQQFVVARWLVIVVGIEYALNEKKKNT